MSERMSDRAITFRAPEAEARRLAAYAAENQRTQTDVMREFLRTLPPPIRPMKARTPRKAP
jgi:hypothetical protein